MKKIIKLKKLLVYLVLVCLIGFFSGCKDKDNGLLVEQPLEDAAAEVGNASTQEAVTQIYVQVCGAVRKPGVYQLKAGSRVFEAVALAGGLNRRADLATLNQAQLLTDGQMVYVFAKGEAAAEQSPGSSGASSVEADQRVNLNLATIDQLMTLPGIGQAKADSIITWRDTNGGFEKIEDIMNIEGIKEGVFAKIKEYIRVN